jgi:hypothetical protein
MSYCHKLNLDIDDFVPFLNKTFLKDPQFCEEFKEEHSQNYFTGMQKLSYFFDRESFTIEKIDWDVCVYFRRRNNIGSIHIDSRVFVPAINIIIGGETKIEFWHMNDTFRKTINSNQLKTLKSNAKLYTFETEEPPDEIHHQREGIYLINAATPHRVTIENDVRRMFSLRSTYFQSNPLKCAVPPTLEEWNEFIKTIESVH